MSLQLAARHLEQHGRGNDTHLVHMTTDELKSLRGLAQAHGGDLSINPKTGLPEAGFLSAILPMALGAVGASFMPELLAGTALEGSAGLVSAGLVGAADYAMTGSLGQGIMAGFGAYSGANLEQSIANFGSAGDQTAANIASQTAPPPTPTSNVIPPDETAGLTPDAQAQIAPNYNLNSQGFPANTPVGTQTIPDGGGTGIAPQSFGTGLQNVMNRPMDYLKAPGNLWKVGSAIIPPVLQLAQASQSTPYTLTPQAIQNPLKLNSPDFQGYNPQGGAPYYKAQYTNFQTNPYVAKRGGLMDVKKFADAGQVYDNVMMTEKALQGLDPYYKAMQDPLDKSHNYALANAKPDAGIYELNASDYANTSPLAQMAKNQIPVVKGLQPKALGSYYAGPVATAQQDIASEQQSNQPYVAAHGGIMHGGMSHHGSDLGSYSDGGHLLKGPGDGVSDSIPATIGGHQPARLAEGEFVIPARIVSELGNGSTDAGAKRLYEMMDRIKAKRAKAKDIAADTKSYKFLPA